MSKSKKKQRARERAKDELSATLVVPAAEAPLVPPQTGEDGEDDEPALALPERQEMPLDQALFDRAVVAATRCGQMREEGDRLHYLFNGESLALKYTEPGEGEDEPGRLLIAAFRQGVVFQVEGERQVVYKPGPWEAELATLTTAEVADDLDDDPMP